MIKGFLSKAFEVLNIYSKDERYKFVLNIAVTDKLELRVKRTRES